VNATVVGGGLAGCEAAWALAERGIDVTLCEMRPVVRTPAHQTDRLAELVCSNSFKSVELTNAHGLLKAELRDLGSLLLQCADLARVPAGAALAVDRDQFSQEVHNRVIAHPRVTVRREEIADLPSPGVVATGPLTSDRLAECISQRLGGTALAFYDAIAPILSAESLDQERLYALSRYGKGEGDDYLNAPLDRDAYESFISELASADQFNGHDFDKVPYFEGCLPIEEMARRGPETLRFGPMKPVGLRDPRSGREPYAVVQLRSENARSGSFNLVGFQNHMRFGEQQRVLRMIPGLQNAEFLRFGQVHRNTYINGPALLTSALQLRTHPNIFFAGQISGVEGYVESIATGLIAGLGAAALAASEGVRAFPRETAMGSLCAYVSGADPANYQPANITFDLLPKLENPPRDRKLRHAEVCRRALAALEQHLYSHA